MTQLHGFLTSSSPPTTSGLSSAHPTENSVASSGVLPMDAASDSGTRAPPKGTALGKLGKNTIFSGGKTPWDSGKRHLVGKKIEKNMYSKIFRD